MERGREFEPTLPSELDPVAVEAVKRVARLSDRVAEALRDCPDASVRRFFAHFPDPWWKKRHQKRLMLAPLLLDHVARLLERGGELFVQTDVEERAAELESQLAGDTRFAPNGDAPDSPRISDHPYVARSPRERRAMADGLPIFRMRWRRV